jgi:hypothetical protein
VPGVDAHPGRAGHGDDRRRPQEPAEPASRAVAPAERGTTGQAGSRDGGEQERARPRPELVPQLGAEEQRGHDGQRAPDVAEHLREHRTAPPPVGRRPVERGDCGGLLGAEDPGRDGPVEQVPQR